MRNFGRAGGGSGSGPAQLIRLEGKHGLTKAAQSSLKLYEDGSTLLIDRTTAPSMQVGGLMAVGTFKGFAPGSSHANYWANVYMDNLYFVRSALDAAEGSIRTMNAVSGTFGLRCI